MKFLNISLFVFLLFFSNIAFGLDVPQNIILDKATDNSLKLSWDKIDNAGVYSVGYGTKTASGGTYEYEKLADENATIVIDKLDPSTKYFIGIKAYDSENNKSEYSKEVSFSTVSQLKKLKINNLIVSDTRDIVLEFNVKLDKNSLLNLNLVNTKNNLENIEVSKYEINGNYLNLFLNNDLKLGENYSLTIITLEGINGETIESGVDGIKEFFVNMNTKSYLEKQDNVEVITNGTGKLEGTGTLKTEQIKILGGKNLNKSKDITESIAKDKKDLPTTGPTETFLFLIFSFIAGILFINLRKKVN